MDGTAYVLANRSPASMAFTRLCAVSGYVRQSGYERLTIRTMF
jgi:hypothetical protein